MFELAFLLFCLLPLCAVFAVIFAFVCHAMAKAKGYDTGLAIVAGVFLGIIGLAIYAALPAKPPRDMDGQSGEDGGAGI